MGAAYAGRVGLPVEAVLPELRRVLSEHGTAVLTAAPGAGKTTLVPLALREQVSGTVIVAEPRRVAARAAARRMACLLGEEVGQSVGYTVRGDRNVGPRTRIEVVTTGVLVARLQHDPELPGVAVVMVDECHERHLDTDLALAFLVDVRTTLRPDLRLLATSATADAKRFAELLGEAPIIDAPTPLFPLETVYTPPARADRGADHVAAVTRQAVGAQRGGVLVFLPGVGDINAVARRLGGLDVAVLHGRLPAAEQDRVLAGGSQVILATAVAESSLTVPGVRCVVDSGLAREPRVDLARGLGTLVTVRASRATADQRAGRAAREGPGRVYRCWAAAEQERRPAYPQPEVALADLTQFALALACWGHPDGAGLALPDAPPPSALQVARETLRALDAVDAEGRPTARGRRLADVGAHPRLARALIDGAPVVGARRAAEVVALLADDTLPTVGDDLVASWRAVRGQARFTAEVKRLLSAARPQDGNEPRMTDDLAAGLLTGLAYPERIAKARSAGAATYLMAGGTAAELAAGSALRGLGWLAIAVADRAPGAAAAKVRLAAAIDEATARRAAAPLLSTVDEATWRNGRASAQRLEKLGAITLSAKAIAADARLTASAWAERIRTEGLDWTPAATALRRRLAFLHAALGAPWPDVSDAALLARVDEWAGTTSGHDVLRALLPWPEASTLDERAPERLRVPSGAKVRVHYDDPAAPVLAVKVQDVFGWPATPVISGVPVVLHLLSPAGRPVAVTSDLDSFWRNGYKQVRAELRGRYPRHRWPEDPRG
jgi:ATP-dependent helicase HrpB